MKKYFYLILCVITFWGCNNQANTPQTSTPQAGTSDTVCDCDSRRVDASLSAPDADKRINEFNNNKYGVLHDNTERTLISCSAKTFLNLLTALTGRKDVNDSVTDVSYDGFRAYFAVDPSCNKMDILFISTTKDTKHLNRHNDDVKNCWIVRKLSKDKDTIVKIDLDTARKWVIGYQQEREEKYLDTNGQRITNAKSFYDTRSLYYKMKYMNGNKKVDVMCYLQHLISHKMIDSVKIKFGSFPHFVDQVRYFRRTYYHLTLVFNYHLNKTSGSIDSYPVVLNGDSNTDTGDPCPPYPKGSTSCSGTINP